MNFDWQSRTRIVVGPNSVEQVGAIARDIGGTRALIVTDPGSVAAGHAARIQKILSNSLIYDKVRENPTTRDVDACVEFAQKSGVDLIVAVGGGSSMDTAKGANFILTNGGRMQDYQGVGKATRPMLPLIAIPTTAGTGSECQSFALIADAESHVKMACGDPKAAPRVAILDPILTLTQPRHVSACTGIDAVAHAVESAGTTRRTALSALFSREAFRLTLESLPIVLTDSQNLEARARMQLGAAFAGLAIENSMLGAAHSAANPLTARFSIVHGHAVGMMLPHVVRFNSETGNCYEDLGPDLAERLDELLSLTQLPKRLSECGISESAIPVLAQEAAGQWTAQFNPRPIVESDFVKLYQQCL